MLIAGEVSGDLLGAQLARALKQQAPTFAPQLFGAAGPQMREAGVESVLDLTQHSVIGLWEVLRKYRSFKRLFDQLLDVALTRRPDVVVGIDFGGFNLRFHRALRKRVQMASGPFNNWKPLQVQFVSPQVWASRPGRAQTIAQSCDLLLSILPFEKAWYSEHAPNVHVEFVGHPIVDRASRSIASVLDAARPEIVLLPGSRRGELESHLPLVLEASRHILAKAPTARFRLVFPSQVLADEFTYRWPLPEYVQSQIGNLETALSSATAALACTGTVTLECAWHQVPTVAFYKTSWSTYQIAKRLITVPFLAMPNLLAQKEILPEFIQSDATPEKLSHAIVQILSTPETRQKQMRELRFVRDQLGAPGAANRAAAAILKLER